MRRGCGIGVLGGALCATRQLTGERDGQDEHGETLTIGFEDIGCNLDGQVAEFLVVSQAVVEAICDG
jgi:hypothetical protein